MDKFVVKMNQEKSVNGHGGQLVTFSTINKVSAFSLEHRVDFHLERIMKKQRLVYFKNSIQMLKIEDRINESLLEIISSSMNLIERRMTLMEQAQSLLDDLSSALAKNGPQKAFQLMADSLVTIKKYISSLGQLIWALNSNKEHVKYVAKVFTLPEIYERPGPDHEEIELKNRIRDMVVKCEWFIEQSRRIRDEYQPIIIQIAINM